MKYNNRYDASKAYNTRYIASPLNVVQQISNGVGDLGVVSGYTGTRWDDYGTC
jgi:hypothetical protein